MINERANKTGSNHRVFTVCCSLVAGCGSLFRLCVDLVRFCSSRGIFKECQNAVLIVLEPKIHHAVCLCRTS